MKKIIALILSAVMLLSLVPAVVLAAPAADEVGKVAAGYTPAGKGIASLTEATDPAGTYYLTADITVSATVDVTFTGTIDGNGKTITVSAPVFTDFSGTLKNAVIAGAVDTTGEAKTTHTGTVGRVSSLGASFENVKNTASVKGWVLDDKNKEKGDISGRIATGGLLGFTTKPVSFVDCANTADVNGYAVGGLLGLASGGNSTVYAENCVNTGKITDTGAVKVGNNGSLGGLVGIADSVKTLTFKNCHNTGDVLGTNGKDVKKAQCPAGGILGYNYIGKGVFDSSCEFTDVSNTGKVMGTNQVGGICGYVCAVTTCTNVVNKGEVVSYCNYAGGIFARAGQDQPETKNTSLVIATFKNCENHGKVTSGNQYAAGMMGYTPYGATAEGCVNYGEIDATLSTSYGDVGGIFGRTAYVTTVLDCYNYGDIKSSSSHNTSAGGIVGRCGVSGQAQRVERCGNFGNIYGGGNHIDYGASGVLGYVWGGNNSTTIRYCFNVGKVVALSTAGSATGLVTYTNTDKPIVIEYCFNAGELVLAENSTGRKIELFYNKNANLNLSGINGNVQLEGEGKTGYIYNVDAPTTVNFPVFTASDLASGKLCYELNKAIGKTVFYQTVGTDKTPTTSSASKVVYLVDGAYTNTAPAAPSPAPTGDSAFAIVLALIAVSCGAVLTMKKAR